MTTGRIRTNKLVTCFTQLEVWRRGREFVNELCHCGRQSCIFIAL